MRNYPWWVAEAAKAENKEHQTAEKKSREDRKRISKEIKNV